MNLLEEQPLVSIIMPVYNGSKTIQRAIQSIINQSYINWELITIDDGSTDNSAEIIRSFNDPRIKLIQQENQGAAASRNNGFNQATGEFITFLDTDDLWLPKKLKTELNTLSKHHTREAFVYSGYSVFDEAGQLFNLPKVKAASGNIFEAMLWNEGMIIPGNLMVHRSIFQAIGGFPSHYRYHEDWYFSMEMAHRFQGFPTKQRLLLYQHSLSGKGRSQKFADHDRAVQLYVKENDYLKEHLTPEQYQHFIDRQKKTLFCSYLMYNYWDKAVDYYAEIPPDILKKDTKGKLALFSMASGINWVYYARLVYQTYLRWIVEPRWKKEDGKYLGFYSGSGLKNTSLKEAS